MNEDNFKKLFYTSPNPITISSISDGVFVAVNKKYVELMGYSEQEIIGKRELDFNIWVHPK